MRAERSAGCERRLHQFDVHPGGEFDEVAGLGRDPDEADYGTALTGLRPAGDANRCIEAKGDARREIALVPAGGEMRFHGRRPLAVEDAGCRARGQLKLPTAERAGKIWRESLPGGRNSVTPP